MVWSEDSEETDTMDVDDDEDDRLFTFEVAKTNEQEENVTPRPGFKVGTSKDNQLHFIQEFMTGSLSIYRTPSFT